MGGWPLRTTGDFAKALADLLRTCGRLVEGILREDEDEFFAAIGDVVGADAAQKSLGDAGQGPVAGGVSELVVVAPEVVEIEHHDGEGAMFAASGVEFAVEKFLHVAAVVEAGERVADGLDAKSFAEVEVGNGAGEMFGCCCGELAAAGKGGSLTVTSCRRASAGNIPCTGRKKKVE